MVLCRYEDIYQPCYTDAKSRNSNNDNQWYYNYWIMWIIILFVCFDSGPATYDKHCFLKPVNTGTIIFFGLLNRCSTQNICGADFAGSNDSMEVYPANLLRSCIFLMKGAGVFGRPGQNMEDLFVFGTSRSSNELKSVPQPPCQLRLMKRYFWSHKICHLWLKIGLF